jgi:hypothetical protein
LSYEIRKENIENVKQKSISSQFPSALMQAKHDYTATGKLNVNGESDMSFKRGDFITILDKRDLWLLGSLNGVVGLVPSNYLIPISSDCIQYVDLKLSTIEIGSAENNVQTAFTNSGSFSENINQNHLSDINQ